VIRRYGNRKLYDPTARRYVTLEDVAQLVARGEEVAVEDQRSGEDLTNLILAQALLERMKQSTSRIPRQVLTRLIRLSAGPASDWGAWPEPQETAGRARAEVERIVGRLLGRGRLSLDDAVTLRQELGQLVHGLVAEAQSGVEARLRALLERGEGAAGRSLDALRGRLHAFESYLEKAPAPTARRAPRRPRRRPAGPRT
jgi:polyhydroxyalkanoate synthesis repressor PhaR